jgi:hypothetical protein
LQYFYHLSNISQKLKILIMKKLLKSKHLMSILVVGLFSLLTFSSGDGQDPSTKDLNASVYFDGLQFAITNNDSFDYINAKLEVNGKFKLTGYTLKAGETYTVGMMQFADKEGNRFNLSQKPLNFSVWCDLTDGKNGFYYAEFK